MKVTLIDSNVGGASTIISGLSLCRDKQCTEQTIDHCMTAKPVPHLAALEMCWFAFLVEGVSVKMRIQLERHRMFSSIERSTRHINMSEAEFVVPPTVKDPELFKAAYTACKMWYMKAIDCEEKEEDAAYLLPLGVTTKFQLAGNGRVWFEYLQKRLCKKKVQREHFLFAREVYKQFVRQMPVFKYAHPCRECRECRADARERPKLTSKLAG